MIELKITGRFPNWWNHFNEINASSVNIDFDGIKIDIEALDSSDPSYPLRNASLINISTGSLIWSGYAGNLEAMCESHQMLKDACRALVIGYVATPSLQEAINLAQEALRRAD